VFKLADSQSAIQPMVNRRYAVTQTVSLPFRRLATGYFLFFSQKPVAPRALFGIFRVPFPRKREGNFR
jgi:hypothetical protein